MYLLSISRFWTQSIERFLFFISIYFELRDTENQQFNNDITVMSKSRQFLIQLLTFLNLRMLLRLCSVAIFYSQMFF